jgi:hypothetical protein
MTSTSAFRICSLVSAFGLTLSGCSSLPLERPASEQEATPVPFQKIVVFDRPVHFQTPEGSDTLVAPGSYSIEIADGGLRLSSADQETAEAVVVQAEATTHDRSVTTPEPLSVKTGQDQQVIVLLLPDGTARQAVGSYTGIVSRHAVPTIKPGALAGLAGLLPKINSLLATPPPPAYDTPPPGNISPFGTLYLKGEQFGSSKGKIMLHVQVPIDKHFHTGVGAVSLPGSKPGTRIVQLEITQWGPDKIIAKMPLVAGVPDHSAVLQVLNAQGLGSLGWNIPFRAMRARMTLRFKENVTKVHCSHGANLDKCMEAGINYDAPYTYEGPCFYSGPHVTDKTISAWHMNCHDVVDFDSGADTYTIELKNNWVIEQVRWGWKPSSTSEKLKLPSAEALTQRYRGAQKMVLTVPWEVSPGPDWLAYWIDVDVKGPAGILYGN